MHCYQLLLRIYSTMEVLWMFYSFCGKPLPERIFSGVCMSLQGCIVRTRDNHSMAKTSIFPRCQGWSLDFALCDQHIRGLKYLEKVLKNASWFLLKGSPFSRRLQEQLHIVSPCDAEIGSVFSVGTSQPPGGSRWTAGGLRKCRKYDYNLEQRKQPNAPE